MSGIGIKAIIYIDDGITTSRSSELAKTTVEKVRSVTIIDTIEMTFTVPSEKINKLLAVIKNILIQNILTPKQLAK